MANPNTPSDPPPSISAAELRRRLLASTPPPMAGGPLTAAEAEAVGLPGNGPDALARLRLPGGPAEPQATIQRRPASGYGAPPSADGSGVRTVPAARPADTGGSGVRGYVNRAPTTDESPQAEAQRLRNENKELRKLLDEMKHLLQEASDTEQQYAVREQEALAQLAEKTRYADELSGQLVAIEEQIASGALSPQQPVAAPKTRTEVEEWADELERDSSKLTQERKKLDAERAQLREDEESLEKQMRDMEVGMARERALMARQETELKRLSAEIQHELEIMQRGDASLRDQMQKFQRRAQDVMQGKVGGGGPPNGAVPGRR